MKQDDFEQRLQRQQLRQVPAEWRKEILSAVESAVAARTSNFAPRTSWLSTLNSQLSTILWPHPRAWAGLAAVWIAIFAVDFSMHDTSQTVARKSSPPSPEVIVELRQQQRLLAELIGPHETHYANQTKLFVPQPRSEQRFEIMTT